MVKLNSPCLLNIVNFTQKFFKFDIHEKKDSLID